MILNLLMENLLIQIKKIREIAIKETIEAVEICNKLDGEVTTIWLANDGFDYPFQVD